MNLVGRCLEHGWGAAADSQSARDWYRRSAEGGYFRGRFNWASVLADDGRIAEAATWFEAALADAPEPSRGAMLAALAAHRAPAVRALADAACAEC